MIYTHGGRAAWAAMGAGRGWAPSKVQPGPARAHPRLPVGPGLQSIYRRKLDLLFEKIEMMEYISTGRELYFFMVI